MTVSANLEQARAFQQDGFALTGSLLSMEEVEIYRDIYDRFLSGEIESGDKRSDLGSHAPRREGVRENITQIMWPSALHKPLLDLPLHSRALAMARALIGDDAVLDFDMLIHKAPHTGVPTPWHQDAAYWIDLPDTRAVSIWVALDEAVPDSGCMWYVRGSHKLPLRPHHPTSDGKNIECDCSEDEPGATAVHVSPGDGIAHAGGTLHYSRGNTTDRVRRAYILNYRPAEMIRLEREQGMDHGLENNERMVRNANADDSAPVSRPVRLSGAVMTHPKRLEEARLLADADVQGRIQVVVDPEPEGRPTALRVAPLSWDCVEPDATHHLVLQDDVVLAEGFYEHAERVAAAVPHEAISFYAGWEARNGAVARLAALTGTQWAYTLQEHVPCQALMLPAEVAKGYARFQEEHGEGWPYDVVIQRYLNARGIPVRFCTPSTVQHDDLPSLAGNSYHGFRQATLFSGRAVDTPASDCPRFPVVPFYQYGDARCAVQHGTEWEYIETARHLRRIGLLDHCQAAFAAAEPSPLSERVSRAVWETGFAIGVVTADEAEPEPSVAAAVMETLGSGGLCEEFTADELLAMAPQVRDLALAALAEGRKAGRLGVRPTEPAPGARVAVTGGDSGFGRQLARLLGDLGRHADHLPGSPEASDLDGVAYVVHLGSPAAGGQLLDDVLAAAEKAGVERLVYAGSAAVYRGSGEQVVTEGALAEPPRDPVALEWWREEERCRQWGEQSGIAVQVLRLADPVGPYAPDNTPVQWIHLAWTRRPLSLNPQGIHQILDYRDMADAIGAVLAAPPAEAVFNVASATYAEEELAGLLADASRRTPWEQSEHEVQRWTMATELIESALRWRGSAPVFEGMRALAQWYACDIHGDYAVQ